MLHAAGPAAAHVDLDEPGAATLWWWGIIGRLDIACHLQTLDRKLDSVRLAEIVEVAAFDLRLAELMLERYDGQLECQCELLADEADPGNGLIPALGRPCHAERPNGELLEPWCAGATNAFDSDIHARWHSRCYLAEPDRLTLRRRLWLGQVRALLPRLEEWRVMLIEQARRTGCIAAAAKVDQLDFRELHDALRHDRSDARRRTLAEFAGWMRETRNQIAHLSPVTPQRLARGEQLALAALKHD